MKKILLYVFAILLSFQAKAQEVLPPYNTAIARAHPDWFHVYKAFYAMKSFIKNSSPIDSNIRKYIEQFDGVLFERTRHDSVSDFSFISKMPVLNGLYVVFSEVSDSTNSIQLIDDSMVSVPVNTIYQPVTVTAHQLFDQLAHFVAADTLRYTAVVLIH